LAILAHSITMECKELCCGGLESGKLVWWCCCSDGDDNLSFHWNDKFHERHVMVDFNVTSSNGVDLCFTDSA